MPPPGYVVRLSPFNDLCGCSIIFLLFWHTIPMMIYTNGCVSDQIRVVYKGRLR